MRNKFEVDVSGEDLLSKNYTICIADNENIIRGFKFSEELVSILSSRFGQNIYKYHKSQKGKATFKVRIYCIVVFYLIKSLKCYKITLTLCKDFEGREKEIRETLMSFCKKEGIGSMILEIYFSRLSPRSNAHKYAYLMRVDNRNLMNAYITIKLEDIEKWLKK